MIAIFGPTASGKSGIAELLADRLGTEVVSADAMQAYRGLPLLTNQPQRPTRLVGIWPLSHEGSVGEYERLAHEAVDDLVARSGHAVVAGGTGLYLRAALVDPQLPPAPGPGERERWEREYEADPGLAYARLTEGDPRAAGRAPPERPQARRAGAGADGCAGRRSPLAKTCSGARQTRLPTLIVGLDVAPAELNRRIVAPHRCDVRAGGCR